MICITDHIRTYLDEFIKEDDGFSDIYSRVIAKDKEESKNALIYINKLLNELVRNQDRDLNYINIHIEGADESTIHHISEFVCIKFFLLAIDTEETAPIESDILGQKLIEHQKMLTYRFRETPPYVSGKKMSLKAKRWVEEKARITAIHKFYTEIAKRRNERCASLQPRTVVNVLHKELNYLLNLFNASPFAVFIDQIRRTSSYVLLNCDKSRNEIDGIKTSNDDYLSDGIENVILIDCERKRVSQSFNSRELSEWSSTGKLTRLIVFSFSNDLFSFNRLKSRLDRIQTRYYSIPKFPSYQAYTILSEELKMLSMPNQIRTPTIDFFGEGHSTFWEDFKLEIGVYEGLYELKSIKMMNVYSLVINKELKQILLDDIFNFSETPKIITNDTRESLRELTTESISSLKTSLNNALDFIIQSPWPNYLSDKVVRVPSIIIPYGMRRHDSFMRALQVALRITRHNKLLTWFDWNVASDDEVIILDYRDVGRFPFGISPNIVELEAKDASKIKCYFLKFLFKNKFDWAIYNYNSNLIKMLNNELRVKYFDWTSLFDNCQSIKPEREDSTIWDFENLYESGNPTANVKVKFKNSTKFKSYSASELFVVKYSMANKFRVYRIEDLLEDDHSDNYSIQMLDELHSELNIYEKIANVKKEEEELQLIRSNYSLDKNEKADRLWKILLKKRCHNNSVDAIYDEVRLYIETRRLKLVSKNTFNEHWINPDSKSLIPREKKVFYSLCEYLGLPKSYFKIMLRLKNAEVQNSRRNSKQMNALLSDLINCGCFDDNADILEILTPLKNQFLSDHDFDEIGFYEETLIEDLEALVELLKPYLNPIQVEKIELSQV